MPYIQFLYDTYIVVTIAAIAFVGILIIVGVPKIIVKLIDKQRDNIVSEISEARKIREEAQLLYADYERKLKEVEEHSARIIENAKLVAQAEAKTAKADLQEAVKRRIAKGEEQIRAAEADVERSIKNRAVDIAVQAVQDTLKASPPKTNFQDLLLQVDKGLN